MAPVAPLPDPASPSTAAIDGVRGPVVVGGVGGSGTRVVAEILRGLDVYMGSDLNTAADNRWFTLLCKLPRWDPTADFAPDNPVLQSLQLLERAMAGRVGPTRRERRVVSAAVERCRDWWFHGRLPDDRPPEWVDARAHSLLHSRRGHPPSVSLWGWKEPNSHILIEHLHHHFGDRLLYVHVVRNGIHMAHSKNQLQVRRWGPMFGVVPESSNPSPTECLDYWIRANEEANRKGLELPTGTFLIVNFDELCTHPRPGTERLVDFLGLHPPGHLLDQLAALPRRLPPRGETGHEAVTRYGAERLARVHALGFPTDGSS